MKKLLSQAVRFVGISGIGWLLDFGVFNLLNLISGRVELHNTLSSLVGLSFVFVVSTRKTFIQKENGIDLKLKYLMYVAYQLVLIAVISILLGRINTALLSLLSGTVLAGFSAMAAKIIVTPITMILNFIVMKLLIERI